MRSMLLLGLAMALPLRGADEPSLPERYAAVYVAINTAEQSERHEDFAGAVVQFKDCYAKLAEIQTSDPDWEAALVVHRMADCKAKILELQPKADVAGQANGAPAAGAPNAALATTNAAPAAAPNLPSNLPPEVKAFQNALPRLEKEADSRPEAAQTLVPVRLHPYNIYPWHTNVVSEPIWIGMDGKKASVWDPNWERDFNGVDTPQDRNGYAPAGHACGRNPFYVSLPFNDLAHPDLARKWLPKGWVREPRNGVARSACKDRWVELKNARGDDCFAQWEDAGPTGNDRASYVFGADGPGKDESGIGLSPAVADYLGMNSKAPGVSWRFVDETNVRPGQWLKLDEQAVMYTAMHGEQK